MFAEAEPYISQALRYLQGLPDWKIRWRPALRESRVGCPRPYFRFPLTSANLINHGFHLANFEEKTRTKVNDHEYILEFGGGYGSMCRLCYNLGFNGKYIIFDLPQFSALQIYYLKCLGIPVQSFEEFRRSVFGVVCISTIEELAQLTSECLKGLRVMFISTWAFSETLVSLRDEITHFLTPCKSFLIGYQAQFAKVDNRAYFDAWKSRFGFRVEWHEWEIKHLPNNYYLIGCDRAGVI